MSGLPAQILLSDYCVQKIGVQTIKNPDGTGLNPVWNDDGHYPTTVIGIQGNICNFGQWYYDPNINRYIIEYEDIWHDQAGNYQSEWSWCWTNLKDDGNGNAIKVGGNGGGGNGGGGTPTTTTDTTTSISTTTVVVGVAAVSVFLYLLLAE